MAPAIASTVVDRPATEVFGYATDPARFHEWQQGVIDGHLDQPGPAQAGAKCLTTRRIGGSNRTVTAEVTHIDAPRTWGVRGIDGPVRATVDVTVEPLTETSSRPRVGPRHGARLVTYCLVPMLVHMAWPFGHGAGTAGLRVPQSCVGSPLTWWSAWERASARRARTCPPRRR
jgi:Polyketide cyclase / dehydrase and lipid transport